MSTPKIKDETYHFYVSCSVTNLTILEIIPNNSPFLGKQKNSFDRIEIFWNIRKLIVVQWLKWCYTYKQKHKLISLFHWWKKYQTGLNKLLGLWHWAENFQAQSVQLMEQKSANLTILDWDGLWANPSILLTRSKKGADPALTCQDKIWKI